MPSHGGRACGDGSRGGPRGQWRAARERKRKARLEQRAEWKALTLNYLRIYLYNIGLYLNITCIYIYLCLLWSLSCDPAPSSVASVVALSPLTPTPFATSHQFARGRAGAPILSFAVNVTSQCGVRLMSRHAREKSGRSTSYEGTAQIHAAHPHTTGTHTINVCTIHLALSFFCLSPTASCSTYPRFLLELRIWGSPVPLFVLLPI